MKGKHVLLGIVLLIGLLYSVALWRWLTATPEQRAAYNAALARSREEAKATNHPAEAMTMCEQWIERRLKAPSTAKFSHVWDTSISGSNDGPYRIDGFVDAQNGFGAMIRTQYSCATQRLPDGRWKLLDLNMN